MPLLGINCLDSFLNFRNRKKPKSSKQKIPAFFIWTKLPLFLLSISHSSRFPFLLTPIPPLLPILHFPLLHLIPFSPTSLFLYSNTPHSSTCPFSYIPTPPPFPIPSHVFFSSKSNHTRTPKKYLCSKIQNQKIPLSFPNAARPSQNHHLLSPTKK